MSGIGFWAPSFLERHAGLSGGAAAGLVGVLILGGAIVGTIVGGRLSDRLRHRSAGAPMLVAAVTQAIGALVLMPVFADVPLAVRVILSGIGVVFIVAGFPALAAMVAEVVPATIRGLAFAVTGFLSALAARALAPADRCHLRSVRVPIRRKDCRQSRLCLRNRDATRVRRRVRRVPGPAFRRGRQGPHARGAPNAALRSAGLSSGPDREKLLA